MEWIGVRYTEKYCVKSVFRRILNLSKIRHGNFNARLGIKPLEKAKLDTFASKLLYLMEKGEN